MMMKGEACGQSGQLRILLLLYGSCPCSFPRCRHHPGLVGGWRKALWRDEVPDAPRSICTGCDAESYMVRSTFDNAAMSSPPPAPVRVINDEEVQR